MNDTNSSNMQIQRREEFGRLFNELNLLGHGIEIGVQTGSFSKIIRSTWKGHFLHLVDRWAYDPGYFDIANVEDDEHKRLYLSVVEYFANDSSVIVYKLASQDAASQFPDAFFDWIYLDADHSYRGCKADLIPWYQKLKPGGLFAGHDFFDAVLTSGIYGVKRAVEEFVHDKNLSLYLTQEEGESKSWYFLKPSIQLSEASLLLQGEAESDPRQFAKIDEQRASITHLEEGNAWLKVQRSYWQRLAEERQDWIAELEKGKAWLEEQRAYWQQRAEAQNQLPGEQKVWIADLQKSITSLEKEWRNWQVEAERVWSQKVGREQELEQQLQSQLADQEQKEKRLMSMLAEREQAIQGLRGRNGVLEAQSAQLQLQLQTLLSTKSYRWSRPISQMYGVLLKALTRKPVLKLVRGKQKEWNISLPLVSVIIPCYNYGSFLEEAIYSVLRQSFQNLEVIVVNDGSTDPETVKLLHDLSQPRTRVLHQENRGLPAARNTGIKQAKGKYICCLDADDTLEPTYLEKATTLLESNPGVAFAYSWARLFGDEEGIWRTEPFDLKKLISYDHISVAAVFARSAWKRAGGYCEEMRQGYEDWEFWINLGSRGFRGQLIPEALFNHRRHGRTMTHSAQASHKQIVSFIAQRHKALFANPQLAERVKSHYYDVRTDLPFLNISRPRDFAQSAANRSLLIIVPWLVTGGAENIIYRVMSGLKTRGFEFFVCSTLQSKNEWHDRFYELTSNIYHLPNFLPEYAWTDFVVNLVRTRNIQKLLVSGSEFGYRMLPELREALPNLCVMDLLHNDSEFGYFRSSVDFDPYIDHHIAVHDRIAAKLSKVGGVSPSKISTINNGVDVEGAFNPARYQTEGLKERWHIPAGRKVVSFIGRLSPEKQPDQFIDLAVKLEERVDVHFVLVGDGPLQALMEDKINQLAFGNRLQWYRGLPAEEIPEILAVTDVLVLTSATEGWGMVVQEALAMGVPVVGYDVGGVSSVVENGTNGFVVEPGGHELLYHRVLELLSNEALLTKFKEQARPTLIRSGLTSERMVQQYCVVLSNGLGDVERKGLKQEP